MAAIVRPAEGDLPTLVLLHGRGGTEHDLVGLARAVAPGWGIIAPRGPEPEGGGFAWFRHHRIGVPVIDSLDTRLGETAEVVSGLAREEGARMPLTVVGFSNGGMMAGALGCARPDLVDSVVLLSSAYPLPAHLYALGGLSGRPVLVLSGGADPFHPPETHEAGVAAHRAAGAVVSDAVDPAGGHGVTPEHARILAKWLQDVRSA